MCGIAGIYSVKRPPGRAEQELVERMLYLERHRGPDGLGIHTLGSTVLGHRRLSILDLSSSGAQPMSNEDGTVWVTFNGEIYNYLALRQELIRLGHAFRSASDTEVLVHGYEEWQIDGLLRRLRGMFAFALYDARVNTTGSDRALLYLARDRMGIKPLYYAWDQDAGRLVFASEVRALVETKVIPGDLNGSALAAFLCLGSIPYPQTYRTHVKCLPPASVLSIARDGCRLSSYWDLRLEGRPPAMLRELLAESVRNHLVADVPVGVFLSGGVDSSAVAALAVEGGTRSLSTVTLSFEEAEFNEAADARRFVSRIGSDHHEFRVTAQDFREQTFNFLSALDQPTVDGVNSYMISRAARQIGLKAILSGVGGDELFFGYRHYRSLVRKSGLLGLYAHAPSLLRVIAATAGSTLGQMGGREQWGRFDYYGGRSLNESLYLLVRGLFPPAQVSELLGMPLGDIHAAVDLAFEPLRVAGENGTVDAARFQELEMRRYLHDQLLRDADLFSMAHSVELRVPLVDHELVQAARSIPIHLQVANGVNKPALVEAVPGVPLLEIAAKPKRSFTLPFERWLKQNAAELEDFAMQGSILNRNAVGKCWSRFRGGRAHWSRAWSTVVLRAIDR